MIDALMMLAAETGGHEETSKTAFYVAGGILAGWAVVLSVIGLQRADWPETGGPAKAVMGITAILVAATVVSSIATG